MNLEDYMDPRKFPLTSQKGSSVHSQLLVDAINFDQLEQAIADGHQLDEEQVKIRQELQIKRPWMKEVGRQATAAAKAAREKTNKLMETSPVESVSNGPSSNQKPETEANEDDYAKHLGEVILSIIKDKSLSKAEKGKKILGALRLLDEEEDTAGAIPVKKNTGKKKSKQTTKSKQSVNSVTDELNESKPSRPLLTPVEPFKPLSAEELKTMCEQVHKILKVTRAQEQRNRELYREIYGEEMPEI